MTLTKRLTISFLRLPIPRRAGHWAVAVLAWLAAWLFLDSRVPDAPFSGDESGWISASLASTRLVLDGGWQDYDHWEPPAAGAWGSLNPPLGKWLLGVPLSVYVRREGVRFDRYYNFWATGRENLLRGNVPPLSLLLAARRIVAFYGSLAVLLLVLLGWRIRNLWTGLAAGAAALGDPLFRTVSTTVWLDAIFLLFFLLVAGMLVGAAQTEDPAARWRKFGGAGFLAGMLGLIKISGLVPVWLAVQGMLLLVGGRGREFWRRVIRPGMVFSAGVLLAAYLLTPFFWPLRGGGQPVPPASAAVRIGLVSAFPPAVPDGSPGIATAAGDVWRGLVRFPELYARWRRFSGYQFSLGLGPWEPNRWGAFHRQLTAEPVRALAFCLCLGFVLFTGLRRIRPGVPPFPEAPLVWMWGCVYLVWLLFLPLNLDRYYLPLILPAYLLAAVAAHDGWRGYRRWRSRGKPGRRADGEKENSTGS
jgi:hypothetical protein